MNDFRFTLDDLVSEKQIWLSTSSNMYEHESSIVWLPGTAFSGYISDVITGDFIAGIRTCAPLPPSRLSHADLNFFLREYMDEVHMVQTSARKKRERNTINLGYRTATLFPKRTVLCAAAPSSMDHAEPNSFIHPSYFSRSAWPTDFDTCGGINSQ